MKESYENTKLVLEKIHHEKYKWNICGDLKVFFCSDCSWDILSTAVLCVNGTAGTEKNIISKNSGQDDIHLFQERKMC
jgi:hypothetical protein